MAGYEQCIDELAQLGVTVYAASVDGADKAREVAEEVSFGVGQGLTRETAAAVGAWWEDKRGFVQPSEFLLRDDGTVVQSSYSDGPLGRMLAEDVCQLVGFLTRG